MMTNEQKSGYIFLIMILILTDDDISRGVQFNLVIFKCGKVLCIVQYCNKKMSF